MLATYMATPIDNYAIQTASFKVITIKNMPLLIKNMSFK